MVVIGKITESVELMCQGSCKIFENTERIYEEDSGRTQGISII